MKVIISPDSFKGTLSSVAAAATIEKALLQLDHTIETICLPIADGGEGTLEAFVVASNGTYVEASVQDPLGRKIKANYGILGDGETCVIEMAQASGITLISSTERNPFKATTYGTGQLILHALNSGYKKFIIGIGGSATNDAGIGMLSALGVKFLDENEKELASDVSSLEKLYKIDSSNMHPFIKDCQFTIACDVNNPLVGPNGASAIFGPQKGAKEEDIAKLDFSLTCFANKVEECMGIRLHDYPGAGAAGGIGGAFLAFFPSTFKKGIDVVLQEVNFEEHLQNAHLVITGEGKSDVQTLSGKAPMGIALKAKEFNIPTILVSGFVEEEHVTQLNSLFKKVVSVVGDNITCDESLEQPKQSLEKRVLQAFKTII